MNIGKTASKDTGNFTTVMRLWLIKDTGKTIYLMVKGVLTTFQENRIRCNLFKALVKFYLHNENIFGLIKLFIIRAQIKIDVLLNFI